MTARPEREPDLAFRRQRRWTPEEDAQIRRWWGRLMALEMARSLGRTKTGTLQRAYKALNLPRLRRRAVATRSCKEVAEVLGTYPEKVGHWLRDGILVGTFTRIPRWQWHVTAFALRQFVETAPWAYDWREIRDPELRAIGARVQQTERYLTVAQVARRLHIGRHQVNALCLRGVIPATKAGRRGHGWVWLVREADMRGRVA